MKIRQEQMKTQQEQIMNLSSDLKNFYEFLRSGNRKRSHDDDNDIPMVKKHKPQQSGQNIPLSSTLSYMV